MVRLKESKVDKEIEARNKFQFHYGTIKSLKPMKLEPDKINFNSTMVRLKARASSEARIAAAFQFHYGTIKRAATDVTY